MARNTTIVDIAFRSQTEQALKEARKYFQSVENMAGDIGIADAIKKDIKEAYQAIDGLYKELRKGLQNGPVNTKAMDAFQKNISNRVEKLEQKTNSLDRTVSELQTVMNGFDTSIISTEISNLEKKIQNLGEATNNTIRELNDFTKETQKRGGQVEFVDSSQIDKVNEILEITRTLNNEIKKTKNQKVGKELFEELSDVKADEQKIKEIVDYVSYAIDELNDLKKGFGKFNLKDLLSDPKAVNSMTYEIKNALSNIQALSYAVEHYDDKISSFTFRNADKSYDEATTKLFRDKYNSYIDSMESDYSYLIKTMQNIIAEGDKQLVKSKSVDITNDQIEKTRKALKDNPLLVPIKISQAEGSLKTQASKIVNKVNENLAKKPLEVPFSFVSKYKTQKRREEIVEQLRNTFQDQVDPKQFEKLVGNLEQQFGEDISIKFKHNLDENIETEIQERLKKIEAAVRKANFTITPTIKITPEEIEKVQQQWGKIVQDNPLKVSTDALKKDTNKVIESAAKKENTIIKALETAIANIKKELKSISNTFNKNFAPEIAENTDNTLRTIGEAIIGVLGDLEKYNNLVRDMKPIKISSDIDTDTLKVLGEVFGDGFEIKIDNSTQEKLQQQINELAVDMKSVFDTGIIHTWSDEFIESVHKAMNALNGISANDKLSDLLRDWSESDKFLSKIFDRNHVVERGGYIKKDGTVVGQYDYNKPEYSRSTMSRSYENKYTEMIGTLHSHPNMAIPGMSMANISDEFKELYALYNAVKDFESEVEKNEFIKNANKGYKTLNELENAIKHNFKAEGDIFSWYQNFKRNNSTFDVVNGTESTSVFRTKDFFDKYGQIFANHMTELQNMLSEKMADVMKSPDLIQQFKSKITQENIVGRLIKSKGGNLEDFYSYIITSSPLSKVLEYDQNKITKASKLFAQADVFNSDLGVINFKSFIKTFLSSRQWHLNEEEVSKLVTKYTTGTGLEEIKKRLKVNPLDLGRSNLLYDYQSEYALQKATEELSKKYPKENLPIIKDVLSYLKTYTHDEFREQNPLGLPVDQLESLSKLGHDEGISNLAKNIQDLHEVIDKLSNTKAFNLGFDSDDINKLALSMETLSKLFDNLKDGKISADIDLSSIDKMEENLDTIFKKLSSILTSLNRFSSMFSTAFDVLPTTELNKEFKGIQKFIDEIGGDTKNWNFTLNKTKDLFGQVFDKYQKYQNHGGKKSFAELFGDPKLADKMQKQYDKQIKAAEESAKAVDKEEKEILEVKLAAGEAAKAKEEFVQANQKVESSAEESTEAVKEEAKQMHNVLSVEKIDISSTKGNQWYKQIKKNIPLLQEYTSSDAINDKWSNTYYFNPEKDIETLEKMIQYLNKLNISQEEYESYIKKIQEIKPYVINAYEERTGRPYEYSEEQKTILKQLESEKLTLSEIVSLWNKLNINAEKAVLFNNDKTVSKTAIGNGDSVNPMVSNVKKFDTMMHSHSNGFTFSPEDMDIVLKYWENGVRKLVLVTNNELQRIDFSSLTKNQVVDFVNDYKKNGGSQNVRQDKLLREKTLSSSLSKYGLELNKNDIQEVAESLEKVDKSAQEAGESKEKFNTANEHLRKGIEESIPNIEGETKALLELIEKMLALGGINYDNIDKFTKTLNKFIKKFGDTSAIENFMKELRNFVNYFNRKDISDRIDNVTDALKRLSDAMKLFQIGDVGYLDKLWKIVKNAKKLKYFNNVPPQQNPNNPNNPQNQNNVQGLISASDPILQDVKLAAEQYIDILGDVYNIQRKVDNQGHEIFRVFGTSKQKLGIDRELTDVTVSQNFASKQRAQDDLNGIINERDRFLNKIAGNSYVENFGITLDKINKLIEEYTLLVKNSPDLITDEDNIKIQAYRAIFKDLLKDAQAMSQSADFLSGKDKAETLSVAVQRTMNLKSAMPKDLMNSFLIMKQSLDSVDVNTPLSKVKEMEQEVQILNKRLAEAGTIGRSMFDKIKISLKSQISQQVAMWFSVYDFIRYGRKFIDTVHQMDDALTEMRKVSDVSVEGLRNYQSETFKTAEAIGTTGLQLQKSTADWLRLGESFEQAKESAKDATILFNVSEFEGIDQATESLISMSQAYKDLDKMEIIDVMNNVGNNFSISTDQLSMALQNAAAVLQTQGNDLYKATALITAGNAITQDYSKTAGGVRTIALRIAG